MGMRNNFLNAYENTIKAEAEAERIQHEKEMQKPKQLDFIGAGEGTKHEVANEVTANETQPASNEASSISDTNAIKANKDIRFGNVGLTQEQMSESFRAETFEESKSESEEN